MLRAHSRKFVLLLLLGLAGCGTVGPRRDAATTVAGRGKESPKQLAMNSTREPPLADPSTMIPTPPSMFPEIPPAPAKDDAIVGMPKPLPANGGGVVPAVDVVTPSETGIAVRSPIERARAVASEQVTESNLDAVRRLHKRANESYNRMEGFECRLTRRETVGNKPMPEEILQYKLRRDPYSLHIKWIGKEAQGRELIYVAGKFDGKVQILTGKGEGSLLPVPVGLRVARLPTDKDVTSKSRFDIREGGMGLGIEWFGRVVAIMERDPAQANRLKYIGAQSRRERESGLEGVEEIIPPDWEPLLPKGGRRTTYFDSESTSPSFGLPVLVVTYADNGREVEYYWFDQLKPGRFSDADFDPDRLWKK
jgi:hypothetical protein